MPKRFNQTNFPLGLAFDDVLLVPQYSAIASRCLIDLKTKFSKKIGLNIPLVSANMDTVTEGQMAIALAIEGGMGVIHRFSTISEQAAQVYKVKRYHHFVIENPITISREATLEQAIVVMKEHHIKGLLVCDDKKNILGILTSRDVKFKTNLKLKVREVMTPRSKLITASLGTTAEQARKIFDQYKIEKLPLLDKKGKLAGLITASDFSKIRRHTNAAKDKDGRLIVAAAVGIKDGLARAEALEKEGVDALVIDIAHGHHEQCLKLIKELKKKFPSVDIVAGNVTTGHGTLDLIKAGVDAVKVGVGPGAACSTRIVAGAGIPQFTAITKAAVAAKKYHIPIIADGGIKNSGDVAKAIAAGAATVMIGNLFAGTLESPGEYYIEDGQAVKIYRGLASRDASLEHRDIQATKDRLDRTPEGVSFRVAYRGEVAKIIRMLLDGLQSGMSYTGAKNIPEFWQKAKFVQITPAGLQESLPRDHRI